MEKIPESEKLQIKIQAAKRWRTRGTKRTSNETTGCGRDECRTVAIVNGDSLIIVSSYH